jgi:hypothetical protein
MLIGYLQKMPRTHCGIRIKTITSTKQDYNQTKGAIMNKSFEITFRNPKSVSSGYQTIIIQADSHFNAKRIFEAMMPGMIYQSYKVVR